LIGFSPQDFRSLDVKLGISLYALIPVHLFLGYLIELAAANQALKAQASRKKSDDKPIKLRKAWQLIAFAHAVNATLCLSITSAVVYWVNIRNVPC